MRTLFYSLCLIILSVGSVTAATPHTDILYGHYEVHADYQLSPGNADAGWRLNVSYNLNDNFNDRTQIVRLDPESTVIIASPATQRSITSAVSRLGAVGQPLWLLPQNNVLGTPFMGARAIMDPGIFQTYFNGAYTPSAQGSISLRLLSVTGSGPEAGGKFALWESDGAGLYFYFGPGTSNLIPTLPPNAHSHFNWGFTKPGCYDLEIEASGRLNPQHGGLLTSSRQTFHFAVPHSGRLQEVSTLRVGRGEWGWNMLLEDAPNRVAYSPQQGFLEAITAAGSVAQDMLPGAVYQMALSLSVVGSRMPDFVGLAPAYGQQGLPEGILDADVCYLRLKKVIGPGHFALISRDGNQRWMDTADGVDESDRVSLSRVGDLNVLAVFSAGGLYQVEVMLEGTTSGSPVLTKSYTLYFGAGLAADYSYEQWSDSFERSHGLPAGTLSDAKGDYDGDGVSQAAEYLLSWHGFDPAQADARLLPRGEPDGESAVMDFYRDTYKDTLTGGPYQINASTSIDLTTWITRSSRVVGQALQTIETGAEEGNAYGRIMRRRMRVVMPQSSARGFFRFAIKP